MKTEFVTYPIALMLKELGYNEPCLAWFGVSEILNHVGEIKLYMVGQPNNYEIYTTKTEYFFCNQKDTDVDAPLWQQTIDWLREQRDIHIVITVNPYSELNEVNGYKIYMNVNSILTCVSNQETQTWSNYKAHEQAILKAIELCQK